MNDTPDRAGKKRPDDPRKARLAEALRANLKRRKAQARARDDRAGPAPSAGTGESEPKD
ncbi:MAG TPA: hypothetical protein PLJ34_06445 [Hyphomicrobiales bacterium]|nr:hypothetical protein [Hyphomicrobiales bacterium]